MHLSRAFTARAQSESTQLRQESSRQPGFAQRWLRKSASVHAVCEQWIALDEGGGGLADSAVSAFTCFMNATNVGADLAATNGGVSSAVVCLMPVGTAPRFLTIDPVRPARVCDTGHTEPPHHLRRKALPPSTASIARPAGFVASGPGAPGASTGRRYGK